MDWSVRRFRGRLGRPDPAHGSSGRGHSAGAQGARVDVIGFGMSAISDIGGAYLQNAKELRAYEAAIDAGHLATVRGHVLDADQTAPTEEEDGLGIQRIGDPHRGRVPGAGDATG